MSIRIKGYCYTGANAEKQSTLALCAEDGTIELQSDLAPATPIASLEISKPIGQIARTITFPNGVMFETTDHDKLNRWLDNHATGVSWIHRLESNWRFVILALLATGLVVFAGARWGIPAASSYIAYKLPPEVSTYIGTGTLETLDDRLFEKSALPDERQALISSRFGKAVEQVNTDFTYQLLFRGGGAIGANAFALPDGTVVITDELIALAKNNDEVMSVLLHEIGHVEHRHSLRMVINHSGLAILSLAILGDVNSAGALVLALPSLLVESSYSRDLESEADDFSLGKMQQDRLDPVHFANLMSRLTHCGFLDMEQIEAKECDKLTKETDAEESLFHYLSSHPATDERIQKFRAASKAELFQ